MIYLNSPKRGTRFGFRRPTLRKSDSLMNFLRKFIDKYKGRS